VTTHHCQILLRSLAAHTADGGTAGLSAALHRAADAAGHARDGWLAAARALNQVDTDTMRHLPLPAARPAIWPCAPAGWPTPMPPGPCPAGPAISPGPRTTLPRTPATSRWRWQPPTTPAMP
jgi:hypothetical protein